MTLKRFVSRIGTLALLALVADHGFMLMLHSHWDTPTPTRGSVLSGKVVDQSGQPGREVLVRLIGYQTVTDARGNYILRILPDKSVSDVMFRLKHQEKPIEFQKLP